MSINLPPTERIHEAFGWPGFPDALFYAAPHALRFDLGGDLPQGTQRFLQAIDRARTIVDAAFDRSGDLTAIVSRFAGERRTRRDAASFDALRNIGFSYPFSPPERVLQDDADHAATFGEDLCRYWYAAEFPNRAGERSTLLWAAIGREMPIQPKVRWLDTIYIVDFKSRIAIWPYDDRGMDVITHDPALLSQLYRQFNGWLLEHDRAAMDEVFGTS